MKTLAGIAIALMLTTGTGLAIAKEKGTAAEAKALVKKAVAYVKEVGKEKALVEFNNPKGKFVHKDLYVFVTDISGVKYCR